MRRHEIAIVVVMAAFSTATVGVAVAGEDDVGVPDATNDEARAADAEFLAKGLQISLDEAAARLDAIDMFEEVALGLALSHPDEFAGMAIDHGETFSMTIFAVGDPTASFRTTVEESNTMPAVSLVSGRRLSHMQLKERTEALHEILVDRLGRRDVVTLPDVLSGRSLVTIGQAPGENPFESSQLVSALQADLGLKNSTYLSTDLQRLADDIVVSATEESASRLDHTYGGGQLSSGCTTGFSVRHWSGTYGVVTAGHCGNGTSANPVRYTMPSPNTYDAPLYQEHGGAWGDLQWHTTPHTEFDDFFVNWHHAALHDAAAVQPKDEVYPGHCIARFGRHTGQSPTQCIFGTDLTVTVSAGTYHKIVALHGRYADGGDSGGPWFSGNTAWGIHSGGKKINGAWYDTMSIADHLGVALGVVVRTS